MFHVKQSALQIPYPSLRPTGQSSLTPLHRLFPPQTLRWFASEYKLAGIICAKPFNRANSGTF